MENSHDHAGEPKFEQEGLLHKKLHFIWNFLKMSLSKRNADIKLLYTSQKIRKVYCVRTVESFSNTNLVLIDIFNSPTLTWGSTSVNNVQEHLPDWTTSEDM